MVNDDVYKSRQDNLKRYLNQKNVDIAIIMNPINIYYFTGFNSNPHERFFALVVDNRKDHVSLFVPALDLNAAEEHAFVESIVAVSETEDPYSKLGNMLGSVSTFGIEKGYVNVHRYEQITKHFVGAKFINIEEFITSQRLYKSTDEITIVRRAVEIIENVMERGIRKVTPGVTELELKAEMEYQMMVLGAEGPAFETTVLSGENSALPHGHSGNRKIQNGDFLLIDMGASVGGYCSDITRTFIVGEGSDQQINMYETVLEANEKAIDSVKIGEPLMNIDRSARGHIKACGYGEYFNHRIGHGLGLDIHEPPSIHEENRQELAPGMLFTIEPGVYIPGFGGVRIEDNVYVHKDGKIEVLTSYPKELTYV